MVIESEEAAEGIADALWGLFGGGGDDADLEGLRPFGKEVRVDGFDDGKLHSFLFLRTPSLAGTFPVFVFVIRLSPSLPPVLI